MQPLKETPGSPSSASSPVQIMSFKLTQPISVVYGVVAHVVGAGQIWVLCLSLPWIAEWPQARILTSQHLDFLWNKGGITTVPTHRAILRIK